MNSFNIDVHQIHRGRPTQSEDKTLCGGIFGQRTVPVKQQLLESLPKISIQLLGLMDLFWRDLLQYTTNYFGSNIVVKDKDW